MPDFYTWLKRQKRLNAGEVLAVDEWGRPIDAPPSGIDESAVQALIDASLTDVISEAEVQDLIDTSVADLPTVAEVETLIDTGLSSLPYSNASIEEAGGSADTVGEALDFIIAKLVDVSIIPSIFDTWDNRAGLTTSEGVTITNATRVAGDGIYSGEFVILANTHANPVLSYSGIAAGTQLRVTADVRSDSGGGTVWSLNVQSGATTIDVSNGAWTTKTATVTVGANGIFTISAGWNPRFANLLIENLGI